MSGLLARLAPFTPWVLGLLVVLGLALLLYMLYLLLGRTSPEEDGGVEEEAAPVDAGTASGPGETSPLALRAAFARAVRALKAYAPGPEGRYRDPWILMLGPEGAGKASALRSVALPRPLPQLAAGAPGWHVFDQGVVLDVPGAMVVGRDGSSDERGWEALLRLLVRHRPERPADGVILVVPASTLLGEGGPDGPARLGDLLYERLRQAQLELALRFPVYVLVSGCEEVPGFTSYAEQLPGGALQDVFGWSTPYSLESAFQPAWVDEAFQEVYRRLTRSSTEILATKSDVPDPDGLFRFPDRFRELLDPLRTVVSALFRESAYHEGFFLRGIYFSGEAATHTREAGAGGGPSLFVTRLLQRKVFPERGLATAFHTGLLHRNRRIKALQVAALLVLLLGGPGLWWGHRSLKASAPAIEAVLGSLHATLAAVDGMGARGGTSVSGSGTDVRVFETLVQMAGINAGRFRSIFLPSSWFSDLDGNVDQNLREGFQQVILPVMRQGIVEWADTMSSYAWTASLAPPAAPVGAPAASGSLSDIPEYTVLRRYLAELGGFATNTLRFNALTVGGASDIEQFASLVEWYFEEPLPIGFTEHDAFYQRALGEATGRPIGEGDRPAFTETAGAVATTLVQAVYDEFFRRVENLDLAMEVITSGSPRYGAEELRRLRDDAVAVERFLQTSDAFWLQPELPVGPRLDTLLLSIPEAGILSGPGLALRFRRDFERVRAERLTELEVRLPSFTRVLGPGTLVAGDSTTAPVLAPGVAELRAGLDDLLTRAFMEPGRFRPAPTLPAYGARPTWDTRPLDEAVALFEELRTFDTLALPRFPNSLQGPVREVTRVAMEQRVREAVNAAMTYELSADASGRRELDRELAARIASFDEAARRIVRLMEMDESSGGPQLTDVLAEVLLLESFDLLAGADSLVAQARPYGGQGSSLADWAVGRPAALAAFGVNDRQALDGYLARQREVIRRVAESHAARVLGYLSLPPVDRLVRTQPDVLGQENLALLDRWRTITRALDLYDAQTPGNSLTELESYIRTGMAATGPAECPVEPVGGAEGTTRDYFLSVRNSLDRAFHQRCAELARSQVEVEYQRLREFFNRSVAGRFPFVSPDDPLDVPDLDPAVARELLAAYDRLVAPLGGDAASVVATLPGGDEAAAFLARLAQLRPVLALALGNPGEPLSARVGYSVEFRTHREAERGGDQIAEWSLAVDGRRSALGDPAEARAGVWRPRESVQLTLRWASGSPDRPVSVVGKARPQVDGQRISLLYDGPWSLLRLFWVHRPTAADVAPGSALEPGTLRLAVATASPGRAPLAGPTGPETVSVVFVRVLLTDPESREALPLPPFPWGAPPLGTARASSGGR